MEFAKYGHGNKCVVAYRNRLSNVYSENNTDSLANAIPCPLLPPYGIIGVEKEETRSEEDVIFLLHLGAKLIPPPLPSAPNETKLWGMGGREEGRALKVGLSLCEGIASGPKKGNKGEREREK